MSPIRIPGPRPAHCAMTEPISLPCSAETHPLPDGRRELVFVVPLDLALGSRLRAGELRNRLMRLLKRQGADGIRVEIASCETRIAAVLAGDGADLTARIAELVAAFRTDPLYPRVVEEVLGISARERLRWTKDRRLGAIEGSEFRRGRRAFRVPRYPVDEIAALATSPAIVARWRAEDQADS